MHTTPSIFFGADHNGFRLKQRLGAWISRRGRRVVDLGAKTLDPRDDYPVFAAAVAQAVARGRGLGVLICGSGHGMAIAANRNRRVRAVLCGSPFSAKMARHDDHANVLVLAAWETTLPRARQILSAWLKTEESRIPRHQRRVAMLSKLGR
ncbi:MAG: ribose-5-phosphate isomerase B [Parcubacteria group bacterium Gr01-1014_31]|nr:MAG: ribose-5-phosphate isomerase B [Parcubacteria group bacterium Gr01-1014_31]